MSLTRVDVEYTTDENNNFFPLKVFWADGRSWRISRVVHTCSSAFDCEGICYTVRIGRATKYIYRISDQWYVDQIP